MTIHDELRAILETEYGLMPRSGYPGTIASGVSPDSKIGSGVQLGKDVSIAEGVELGDGVQIGNRVTLRNCRLGNGVRIEDGCIIGYETLTGGFSHPFDEHKQILPTVIGETTLVRTGCIIYQSVTIGEGCWINHNVVLREHTRIGHHTCIGTMSDSEGYNTIGSHVLIHSQVHLCARMTIEDYVFVGPFTVFANGNPMGYAREINSTEEGCTVRFGVQIGVNAVIMPRVIVGYEAWIGPSTVVNRDVPNLAMVVGSPGRIIGAVPPALRMPLEMRRRYYRGADDPPDGTRVSE